MSAATAGHHDRHHWSSPAAVVDRIPGAAWWCLPLALLPCGRVVIDGRRGEMIGKGLFEERGDGRHGRGYRLAIDSVRFPEALDVRPGDRLTIDDARVFEVVSVETEERSQVVLHLARG